MDYKNAGGYRGWLQISRTYERACKTMREEVLGGLGGFSGAFSLAKLKKWKSRFFFQEQTDVEQK